MVSRILSFARFGLVAAIMGAGVSAAVAQGDGRFDSRSTTSTETCAVFGNCGGSVGGYRQRPALRDTDRPIVRRHRPEFRNHDYRRHERRHRPRYYPRPHQTYDYDNGPDIYLDLSGPRQVYEPPLYPRRHYRTSELSEAHVRWCLDRYRSYRIRDNTFKPNRGARRECISPYI